MEGHDHGKHPDSHGKHPQTERHDVSIKPDPTRLQPDEPAGLTITVSERETGNRAGRFQLIHDKLMHLIIVSDDLSYFAHIHPQFDDKEKIFFITHTFPMAGRYKVWVDAKPYGGEQFVKRFDLEVDGKPTRPVPLVADKNFTKNVAAAGGQEYQVQLQAPEEIKAGRDAEIAFRLSDLRGRPITDLEPLMAAGGHCVIISSDTSRFLHVHPLEEVTPAWRGGPGVAFKTNFPSPGLYKAWGQFQHRKNVITADFTLEVAR